ncbi:IS5 family transposase [Carnobacterium funditum]|uniref:IS5 family transposase n=1 Tax=Carnobacterium funditum TaxID=2752 RepID=UPI000A07A550
MEYRFNRCNGASAECRCKKRGLNSVISQHIGKSSGGHTTKIHVIVDGLGNPLYFQLSGGNLHDSVLAIEVLQHVEIQGSNVIGDRAYGSLDIRTYVTNHDATYTIPPKKNTKEPWTVDWWLYKERHLVECFFNKLKHFRHIAICDC